MHAAKPAIPRRLAPFISDQCCGAFCDLLDQVITDIDSPCPRLECPNNLRIASLLSAFRIRRN